MDEFALTTSELVGRLTRIVAQEPMTPNARDHVQLAAVRLGVQNTEIDRLRAEQASPRMVEVVCEACDGSGYVAGHHGLTGRMCRACGGQGVFEEDA